MNNSYDQQLAELQSKAKKISEEYATLVKRAREKEAEGEAIKQEFIKLKKLKLENRDLLGRRRFTNLVMRY
jgi:hypothetical protein